MCIRDRAYIDKYGYDPDIYAGTGGNNKVMRLVLDALKLQTCNAVTFISARDKIICLLYTSRCV